MTTRQYISPTADMVRVEPLHFMATSPDIPVYDDEISTPTATNESCFWNKGLWGND